MHAVQCVCVCTYKPLTNGVCTYVLTTVKVNNFAKEALAGTNGDFFAEIFCSAPYVTVFISEFRGCKYGCSMAAIVYECV